MQSTAMWLASIFGPLLMVLGFWMLLYSSNLMKVINAIKSSAGIFYYSSVFNLLVGFTVLSQYNLWGWNVLVFVTILGWFMVVRGIMGLFVPKLLIDLLMGNAGLTRVCGIIPLLWGLVLAWIGFFM